MMSAMCIPCGVVTHLLWVIACAFPVATEKKKFKPIAKGSSLHMEPSYWYWVNFQVLLVQRRSKLWFYLNSKLGAIKRNKSLTVGSFCEAAFHPTPVTITLC